MAHDGRRSGVDLRRAAGADVGDGNPPARHRPREAADQLRGALISMQIPTHRGIQLFFLAIVALISVAVFGCRAEQPEHAPVQTPTSPQAQAADPETQKLQRMTARFAPVDLTVDIAALPPNERQSLAKMVEASRVFDALFLRQVWEGNEPMLIE